MSSSSDSSSSDVEIDILNIIGGDNKALLTQAPLLKRRRVRNSLPEEKFPPLKDDDFNIEIPNIFKIQAKKNEELLNNDRQIKEYMQKEEEGVATQYNKILIHKQEILDELNDNNTGPKYTLSENSSNELVENLVKQANQYGDDSLARRFFFYTTTSNEKLNFTVPTTISSHLFQLEPQMISRLFKINITQLIKYCLSNCTNVKEFQVALNTLDFITKESLEIGVDEFANYLKFMGADLAVLNADSIKLKLKGGLSNVPLHIWRLTILFKYAIVCAKSELLYEKILKAFILTILDYNLNRYGYNNIRDFTSVVFKELVEWRMNYLSKKITDENKIYNSIVLEIKNMMNILLIPRKYNNNKIVLNKNQYELTFKVIEILQSCHGSLLASTIILLLSVSLLINSPPPPLRLMLEDGVYIIITLKAYFKDIEIVTFENISNENSITYLNKVYLTYYKILQLQSIFYQRFQISYVISNERDDLERFKTELKELAIIIGKLEKTLFNQLKLVGIIDLKGKQLYYKDEMIKYTTSSYRIINLLHKQLNKEVGYEGTGSFYTR